MPTALGVIGGDVAEEVSLAPAVSALGSGVINVPIVFEHVEAEWAASTDGLQMKKDTPPVGEPPSEVPWSTAVSCHELPMVGVVPDASPGVVVIGASGQVEKGPGPTRSEKSLVWLLEVWLSAMNELAQVAPTPAAVRSMTPSSNPPAGTVVVAPLVSRQTQPPQGMSLALKVKVAWLELSAVPAL